MNRKTKLITTTTEYLDYLINEWIKDNKVKIIATHFSTARDKYAFKYSALIEYEDL